MSKLNVVYAGPIDNRLDRALRHLVEEHEGTTMGGGCSAVPPVERDLMFHVPDEHYARLRERMETRWPHLTLTSDED